MASSIFMRAPLCAGIVGKQDCLASRRIGASGLPSYELAGAEFLFIRDIERILVDLSRYERNH